MRHFKNISIGLLILLASAARGQDTSVRWQRSAIEEDSYLQLFHSTHSISLPTSETHQKGDFEFEISHRFLPPVDDGFDELYGLDGPVNMRIALGYAVTDQMLVTLGRSNNDNNLDLTLKYRLFQINSEVMPVVITVRPGFAWSPIRLVTLDEEGELQFRDRSHERNFQYYGQLIINTLIHKKVGLGLVPTVLINRDIRLPSRENSFVLGINGQYYLNQHWSLLGEWAVTLSDRYDRHNPGGIGIELETGGHFFKLFVTNQILVNPSQYLSGADYPFDRKNLRLGFMVTRLM